MFLLPDLDKQHDNLDKKEELTNREFKSKKKMELLKTRFQGIRTPALTNRTKTPAALTEV